MFQILRNPRNPEALKYAVPMKFIGTPLCGIFKRSICLSTVKSFSEISADSSECSERVRDSQSSEQSLSLSSVKSACRQRRPVPNRIQKLVCCSRFCNSIFRIWVYRLLAYYTLQGAGLPASARLWQAEWGGREISWTLNELTWLINMCTFWVHDESKAVQTFLMHFIADSRKINATSGMYFSQL